MTVKRKQLGSLSDEFVKCRSRTWGHMWDDIPSPSQEHYWSIQPDALERCVRCTSEKFLWFDSEGNIVARQYDYAEGYLLSGLYRGDRLTFAELRMEVVRRNRQNKPKKTTKERRLRSVS